MYNEWDLLSHLPPPITFRFICLIYIFLAFQPSVTSRVPYNGTTSPITAAPSPPMVTTCAASCTQYPVVLTTMYWLSQNFSTTITAATLMYIINNRTNMTRTETKYASGFDPYYPSNALGTRTTFLSISYNHNSSFTTHL